MKLFWCETDDHHEDWFVVAKNKTIAKAFHAEQEGYERSDVSATLVLEIPPSIEADEGWPTEDIIKALGGVYLSVSPCVVQIRGNTYGEGLLQHEIDIASDDLFEAQGHGRPNGTTKRGTGQ